MDKKNMSWVVGKVGICKDIDLGIARVDGKKSDVHYVYIHSIDKNNKCIVSTITSMYDSSGKFKDKAVYNGNTLPIPKHSTNIKHFSGLNKSKICDIDVFKIYRIGSTFLLTDDYLKAYKYW